MRPTKTLGLVMVAASVLACREAPAQQGQAQRSATPVAIAGVVRADTVAQGILACQKDFRGSQPPGDDVTLVVAELVGGS